MTDAVDPLTGQAFEALWANDLAPALSKLEGERRKAMGRARLIWLGVAALLAVECAITWMISHGQGWFPEEHVFFITLIGGAVVGYIPLQLVSSKAKARLIQTLCAPMGVSYTLKPGEPDGFRTLQALKLLPDNVDTAFEDMFAGKRAECDFMLCEATLTRGSGKNRHTVFQGQMFKVAFPQRFLGTTVVLRDSGWLNRFECPKGLEKVGLEDPHFEKIFEVFGDDQVEARAILTPDFMQRLVELETAYAGNHIRCGFQAGTVLIALQGKDRFEVGSMFASLEDKARAQSMASDIGAVLRLIDAFLDAARKRLAA
jgi:hypothetical protein